jgi:hypothetical protein
MNRLLFLKSTAVFSLSAWLARRTAFVNLQTLQNNNPLIFEFAAKHLAQGKKEGFLRKF